MRIRDGQAGRDIQAQRPLTAPRVSEERAAAGTSSAAAAGSLVVPPLGDKALPDEPSPKKGPGVPDHPRRSDLSAACKPRATRKSSGSAGPRRRQAEAGHVMCRFAMGRSKASRASRPGLVQLGLVVHRRDTLGRSGTYCASRRGLRACGQVGHSGCSAPASPRNSHVRALTALVVELRLGLAAWDVLAERELRWLERDTSALIGSVRLGAMGENASSTAPTSRCSPRRGRAVSIELELTVKAHRRLVTICRALRAGPPPARRLLPRHAGRRQSLSQSGEGRAGQERITVLALDGVGELVTRELEGVGSRRNTA